MELKKLNQLRKKGQPLYARNLTKTIITANDGESRFELGPVGSDSCVRQIPDSKLDMPGVQSLIRNGHLEIGGPELFDVLDIETDTRGVSEKNIEGTGLNVVVEEDKAKKDLVEKKCLLTGKTVFQTVEQVKNGVPPLHESVADRAKEFVLRYTQNEDGTQEPTWDHVKIG